jgi:predicted NBD/HSP70 family sugar kinase
VVWSQSSAPCGIGVYIRRKSLRGLAVNLDGEVIEGTHRRVELTAGDEHEGPVPVPTVVEAVASLVDGILADHPELRASVTGLGVAAGGHVDARTGVVRFSTTLGWSDVALADLLRAATGIHTVVVHNDCSALALAEQAFGGGRYLPTFAVVTCRFGIGCALVHDNGLVVGANGSASELGHIVRDPAGRPACAGATAASRPSPHPRRSRWPSGVSGRRSRPPATSSSWPRRATTWQPPRSPGPGRRSGGASPCWPTWPTPA